MKQLGLGLLTICFIMFSVVSVKSNPNVSSETKIKASKEVPAFFNDNDKDKDKGKKKSKSNKCESKCSSADKDAKKCCPSSASTQNKDCNTRPYSSECCHKGSKTSTTPTPDKNKDK